MAEAAGLYKRVTYKRQTARGTPALGAGASELRRVSSTLGLKKQTYQSNEKRSDQQILDMRHGVRSIEGALSGELAPGSYADFISAALRRDFAAVTALTGLSITVAGSGPTYTLTRAAGDFLAGGVKRGDVVRLTAGSFTAGNLNNNLLVIGVTALVLTVIMLNGSSLTAEGPIASATISFPGKKTWTPTTGHTDVVYTYEHWFPETPASEAFTDVQPTKVDISLPATGLATVNIGFVGKDQLPATSAQHTSPSAAGTQGLTAAVNGALLVGGQLVGTITALTINLMSDRAGSPVVGANTIPKRFPAPIMVQGQFTAYFADTTFRDAFDAETEVEIICALTSDNSAASDFISFAMPRVKLNGNDKDDPNEGVIQTVPFMALRALTGGAGVANELTTLAIQDSAA